MDLPAPVAPTRATVCPAGICSSTCSSASAGSGAPSRLADEALPASAPRHRPAVGCGCGRACAGRRPPAPDRAWLVTEGHVLEADLAPDRAEVLRPGGVLEGRLDVEQPEDLLQRGHPRLVGGVQLGELLDRFEQERQRGHEGHDRAHRDVAVDRLVAPVQHDHRERHAGHHFHGREVGRVEAHGDHVRLAVVLVELGEAGLMGRLLAEAADHPDARQRLLQVAGDRPDRLSRAPEGTGRHEPEPDAGAGHERHHAERQQRELRIEVHEYRDRPDQRQARLEERHDRVRDEVFQRLHVVGDPRDQHPRGAALVEADRLALQVGEDADPQVRQGALPDPPDEVGLGVGGAPHEDRREQECTHHEGEHFRVVLGDALVDREPRQQWRGERGAGADHQREQHRRHTRAVGRHQRQQAPQVATAVATGGALAVPLSGAGGARSQADPAADVASAPARAHGAHRSPPDGLPASTPRPADSTAARGRGPGVGGHDLAVQGGALQQLGVRPLGHQVAMVEHHDLVGQGDRREPVGDHERRATRHRLGKCQLDALLGGGVHRGGGVVEHQHARVRQQRPRDRQSLALATGQGQAALADLGLIALRQAA